MVYKIVASIGAALFSAALYVLKSHVDTARRDNVRLALALGEVQKRLDLLENWVLKYGNDQKAQQDYQNQLTETETKPKMEPKPQRPSWKQFRTMAERASEREEA